MPDDVIDHWREREYSEDELRLAWSDGARLWIAPLVATAPGRVAHPFHVDRTFWLFGLSALVLAAVGIYGVIACAVERRMHEIGCGWRSVRGAAT